MNPKRPNLVFERLAGVCLAAVCIALAAILALEARPQPHLVSGNFRVGLFAVNVLCLFLSVRKRVTDFAFIFGLAAVLFNPFIMPPLSERNMIIALMLLTMLFSWVFIAPHRSAVAPAVAAPPSTPPPLPPVSSPPAEAAPAEAAPEGQATVVETIHMVLGGPAPGVPFTNETISLIGTAVRTVDAAGRRGMEVRTFKGADTLTYLEASAAIYWQKQIDDNTIYLGKAVKWLRGMSRQTGTHYLHDNPGEPVTEMLIMAGLAAISVHYAVAYHHRLGLPDEVERAITDQGPQSIRTRRPQLHPSAAKLRAAMDDGSKLSPLHGPFFDHIQSSIPWATGEKVDHLNPA